MEGMDFPPVVNSVKKINSLLSVAASRTCPARRKGLPCSSASEEPASKETGRFSDDPSVPCETAPAGRAWSCYLFPILALTALLMPSLRKSFFYLYSLHTVHLPFQSIYCRFHPDHRRAGCTAHIIAIGKQRRDHCSVAVPPSRMHKKHSVFPGNPFNALHTGQQAFQCPVVGPSPPAPAHRPLRCVAVLPDRLWSRRQSASL